MATFNLAQQIDVRGTRCADIDVLYGPYESIEAANAAIPSARRAIGRTVAVIENGAAVEYWYKSGVTDEDLVLKVAETVPKLEYTEEYPEGTVLHGELGKTLSVAVKFTSQTYGQCTITVYKDGSLLKNIKANKGTVLIDFGKPSTEGTSTYTVTGVDALTIPAQETLTFRAVVGGAKISTDFQKIIDDGINTESNIKITYNASIADSSKTVKVKGLLTNSEGGTVTTYEAIGTGTSLSNQIWDLGAIGTAGTYTLTMYSYTGASYSDTSGDNVTTNVSYTFVLMGAGEFMMFSTLDSYTCDTNTAIIIPYRIFSGTRLTLQAHGQVIDGNNNVIAGYTLNRSVDSNVQNYWSLGKISPEGNYTIKMWATTVGDEDSTSGRVYVNIPTVVTPYQASYSIVTDNLIADFEADGKSNNNQSDIGIWRNSVPNSNIYFQLNDLNYNTNGWKHVDESLPDSEPAGEMMLKFTGDSYGVLKQRSGNTPASTDADYNPMNVLRSDGTTGFTAEIIYRTRCIGELNAKVITGHSNEGVGTAGFSASFDTITVGSNDGTVKLDASEDEWIHATMVIDRTIHTDVTDVQDYAPRKLMTIYINGSACASMIITDTMNFNNYGSVLLNAALNSTYNRIDFFGACEIKAIRFYNRPLHASEVVNNYIASIFDADRQATIAGRNGDVLPIVRFVNVRQTHPQVKKEGIKIVDFEDLNKMTEKVYQKTNYVCARVLYQEDSRSEIVEWPRCIVQTQGTSTLAFPVKNYKIKLYQDADNPDGTNNYKNKLKTNVFASKGWKDESVFTLKCDYMEAAHLNNTPSCEFYNEMIDSLVEDGTIATGWNSDNTVYTAANDERTPARRDGMFDAIKGFPCLVYYYESETDYDAGNGVYVGSYMFNLDKSADSLGFDAPAKFDEDGETPIQIENPRYVAGGEVPQYLDNICQSFEGLANSSNTAGCFYSYEDWKDSAYPIYLNYAFERYQEAGGTIDNLEDFIDYYLVQHPGEPYREDSEDVPEGIYNDHGILLEKDVYTSSIYATEYDYYAADYDMRYDWDDLKEGGEEFWGNSQWGLKRMIDWVSDASKTVETDNNRFHDEFSNYFNLEYCLLYYLQMMVFGQVDNAGKNAMWDTWDGIHWAPRPYDLDTMAGLDNTGFEIIGPDAEIIPELSPYKNINSTDANSGYGSNVSELANERYKAFNTRTSRFWISFAKSFSDRIESAYKHLRDNGTYTVEHIMQKFLSKTSDIIGESYYNKDMATKFYKLSDIETFISRMHGNRVQRFKSWISKRIAFCDSLFNYSSLTLSLNNIISFRSDVYETSTVAKNIVIKTYSPQYVRVNAGSGQAIVEAYCSPDARYIDPDSVDKTPKEGTLFTIPFNSGNKEVTITGGGNIKEIVNLGALKPSSLNLSNARKLARLDVSYSSKLTSLALSNNTFLQYINATESTQLGTDSSGAQLVLSGCENLKYLYLDRTKLTSIAFPVGGALKEVSLANTTITSVNLQSLYFLTTLNVTGCDNLREYVIVNCPKITSLSINSLPVTDVTITDCDALETVSLQSDNSIANFTMTRCPNISELSFVNSRSQSLSALDLTTLYSLETLNIQGSSVHTIKLPRNESATSSVPWGANFTTFLMTGSEIQYIQYGETASTGVDMSQLTALSSVSFSNCSNVEHITGLNYTGACNSLFYNCSNLQSISGSLTCNGSATRIFRECTSLEDVSNLSFNFAGCTSLAEAFYRCPWVTYPEIKRLLNTCSNSLATISHLCFEKWRTGTAPDGTAIYAEYDSTEYTALPAGFFQNCSGVTTTRLAFYSSGLITASNDAFGIGNEAFLTSCTNASCMFAVTQLRTLPDRIIRYLPAATDVSGLFQNCSQINSTLTVDFFKSTGSAFNYTITSIKGIFRGCSNLVIDASHMSDIMAVLKRLQNAEIAFSECSKLTGQLTDAVFMQNDNLVSIAGVFRKTGITGLPYRLFSEGLESSTLPYLTNVSGVFEGCTEITSSPGPDLFMRASKVTNAGEYTTQYPTGGPCNIGGMFQGCTGITSFDSALLSTMPLLQNISGLFNGCTNLTYQTGGGFSGSMLSSHANLTNVSRIFKNCVNLTVTIIPQLFTASKNTITAAESVFENCTLIQGFDASMFTNMPRLTNVSSAFAGCTSLSTQISNINTFAGCTSLENVSNFYKGCSSITGSIPVTLFNDCRSTLQNTSSMFEGCGELNGTIETGNEDTFASDNPQLQLGLLAECLNLTTTSKMFYNCNKIGGAVPWDCFWTRRSDLIYTKLTDVSYMFYSVGFTTPTAYGSSNYLFHPEFLSKLFAVTTMSNMFARNLFYVDKWGGTYPVYPTAFDGQFRLTSIREIFHNCTGLGGSIANYWFRNSLSSLTDAYGAFAATSIIGVGNEFLRVDSNTPNTKLIKASRMFYKCNTITSALPAMNDIEVFKKIDYTNPDECYLGYAYNCVNASNYSSFDEDWRKELNYQN